MRPGDPPRPVDLAIAWRGLDLAGTLHLPPGSGPFPVVVMMQGSGPTDRDSDGYFPPIRDAFVGRGVAAYSFDKPGCGRSTGDWHHHALFDRCDQVEAALETVRHHPLIDAARVGVFGHSQGGWMAQILAGRGGDGDDGGLRPAFAVASSGPAIGVAAQDRHAIAQRLRLDGHPEPAVGEALGVLDRLQAAAMADADHATVVTEVLGAVHDRPWFAVLDIGEADWALTRRFLHEAYDPADALRRVSCPFLAVYGGRDVLLPALESANDCGRFLAEAPCRDSTVVVYPGGDHRLRDAGGGPVPGYLDLLAAWTALRVRR